MPTEDQALKGQPDNTLPDQEPSFTEDDNSGGQVEAQKLYLGKFKTPEEMAEAYQQSERNMHKATERAAQLDQLISDTVRHQQMQQMQQQQQQQMSPEEYADRIRESLETNPVETIHHLLNERDARLRQELAIFTEVQSSIGQFLQTNPEYSTAELQTALASVMNEYINKDPSLARMPQLQKLEKAKELFEKFEERRFDNMQKKRKTKEAEMQKIAAMEGSGGDRVTGAKAPETQGYDEYIRQRQAQKEQHRRRV